MAQVEMNTLAPEFTLTDYRGNEVSLAQFRGEKQVLLVFNRGFM